MDIELDLEKIKKLGELHENENLKFRTFLKQNSDNKVDRIVHGLNREVSALIDCTTCGNCCKNLKPSITHEDLDRLANRLSITPQQIENDYTELDEGVLYFSHLPCSFLNDNKCTIYNDRPEDCRSFPHLHKEYFTSRLWGVIDNYSICPIVFNVFEELKIKFNWSKR